MMETIWTTAKPQLSNLVSIFSKRTVAELENVAVNQRAMTNRSNLTGFFPSSLTLMIFCEEEQIASHNSP